MVGLKYFGTQVTLAILVGILMISSQMAYGKQTTPDCWLTKEHGERSKCLKEQLPDCIWKQWEAAQNAKPSPDDCEYLPCTYEGDVTIWEVNLDADKSTREFVLRFPLIPTGGTDEYHPFTIQQATKGSCRTLMSGNGLLSVLKARNNGYLGLYEHAALGGLFCYFGLYTWDGKEYKIKEEIRDGSCEDTKKWHRRIGPVHLVVPRP